MFVLVGKGGCFQPWSPAALVTARPSQLGLGPLGLWQKPLAVRAGCRYDWWQHVVLSAGLGST